MTRSNLARCLIAVCIAAMPVAGSASVTMRSFNFRSISGSILLSERYDFSSSVSAIRLLGPVTSNSVYSTPQSSWTSHWAGFHTLPRISFHGGQPPGDQPIPEPSGALLFAVGAGIVALRLRGERRGA